MASRQNKLFFGMLHTAFSTNSNIDWAFKSNLVHFVGLTDTLRQTRSLRSSPITNIMKYLYDAKPYHTYFTSIIEQWITKNEDMFVNIVDEISTEIEIKYENVLYEPDICGFDCLPYDAEAPGVNNKGSLNNLYDKDYCFNHSTGNKSIDVLDENGNYDEDKYESDPDYYVSKAEFETAPGKYGYFGVSSFDIAEESLQYGCFDKSLTISDIEAIARANNSSVYDILVKYFEDPYYYDNLANKLYFLHPTYEFDKISRMLGNEYKLTMLTPYVNDHNYSVIFDGVNSYISAKNYNTPQIDYDKSGLDSYSFNYDLYDFLTYENQYFITNDLSDDSHFKEFTSEYIITKKLFSNYIGSFNTTQLEKTEGNSGNIAYNTTTNTEWKCEGLVDNPLYLGEVYSINEVTVTPELGSVVDVHKTKTEWEYRLVSYYLGAYPTTNKIQSLTKIENYFCDNLETNTEWKCETVDNPKYLGVFSNYIGEYTADYGIYDISTGNLNAGDFCDNLETETEWEYQIVSGINSTTPVYSWVDTNRPIGTTPKSKYDYNPSANIGDIIVDKHYMETTYKNNNNVVLVDRWHPYYVYKGIGWIDTNEFITAFTPEEDIITSCDVLYTQDLKNIPDPKINDWVNNYETNTEWMYIQDAVVNDSYIGEFTNEQALMDLVKVNPETGNVVNVHFGDIADNLETNTEWKYIKINPYYLGTYRLPEEAPTADESLYNNNSYIKIDDIKWVIIKNENNEYEWVSTEEILDDKTRTYNGYYYKTLAKWVDTKKAIETTVRYYPGWVNSERPIGTLPDDDGSHKKIENGIWVKNIRMLNNVPYPEFGGYVKNYETQTWWRYYYQWDNTNIAATDETVYKSLEWVDTENPIGTTPYSSNGWADTNRAIGTTPHTMVSWVDTENPIGTTPLPNNTTFESPVSTFKSEKLVVYVTDLSSNICTLQVANYEVENGKVIFNEPVPYNSIVKVCTLDYDYLYDMIYASNSDDVNEDVIIDGTKMDRPYVGKKGSEQIDIRTTDSLSIQVLTNSMLVDNPAQGFDSSPWDMLGWDIGSENNDNFSGGINIEEQTFTSSNYQELSQQPLDNNAILPFINGLYQEQFDIVWDDSLQSVILADHRLNPQIKIEGNNEKTVISYGVDYLNLNKQYKFFGTQESTFEVENEFPESQVLVTVNGDRVGFSIDDTTITLDNPLSEASDVIIYTFSNSEYEKLDKNKYSGSSEYTLSEISSLSYPQCYSDLFVFDSNGKKLNPVFMKWITIDDTTIYTYDLPVLNPFSGDILVYQGNTTQFKDLILLSDTAYSIDGDKITFNSVSKNNSFLIVCNNNSNDYVISSEKDKITLNQSMDITTYQVTNSINIGIRLDVLQIDKDTKDIPIYSTPYDYNDIFVWVDGVLLSGHKYNYSYKKLTLSDDVIVDDNIHTIQIMYNSNPIALPPVCVQQVVTNKGETKYFRVSDKYSTKLSNDFKVYDNYIEVAAANVLTQPKINLESPRLSIPGRILVNGEIIEFWNVDYNTTPHRLLNINRGVYGTGYNGNNESQFNKIHLKDSVVYDLGNKQEIYGGKKDSSSRTIYYKVIENWETDFELTNNKNIKPYYNTPNIDNVDIVKVWCNPIIETISDLRPSDDLVVLSNANAINSPAPTSIESSIGEYILDRCPSKSYIWWERTEEPATKGEWVQNASYIKGDIVTYGSSNYKALRNVPPQTQFAVVSSSGVYTLTLDNSIIVTISNGLNPVYVRETIQITTNDLEEFVNNINEIFNHKYPSLGVSFKYVTVTYPEYGTIFRVSVNNGYTISIRNGRGYPLQEIFGGAYWSSIPAENPRKNNGIVINGQNIVFADPTIGGIVARINSFSSQTHVAAMADHDYNTFELISLDGHDITLGNLNGYDDLGNLGLPNIIYGSSEIYINDDGNSSVKSKITSYASIKVNNHLVNYQTLIDQGSQVTLYGLKNTQYWEYIKNYDSNTDTKYRFWYAGNKYSVGDYVVYDNKLYRALIDIPPLQEFEIYGNGMYDTIPAGTKFNSPKFIEINKSEYIIDNNKLTFNSQPELESIIRIQNIPNKGMVIIGDNIQKGYNDVSKFLLKAPFYSSL